MANVQRAWFITLAGLMFAMAAAVARGQAALPAEIEDPGVLHVNSELPHVTLMPYGGLAEALAGDRRGSSFAMSLNGKWKFHWVKTPGERPVGFYEPGFDVSSWGEIPVPSCWQLLGYGTPYYRNFGYTFKRDYPRVMSDPPKAYTAYVERNPVGSYRREFEVPANFAGRRVFISFDGVDSAFFLWVNGQKVGYYANSRNTAEFELTKYLKPGANVLAAEVYRYNAGSYLEDQDMWRLSGIFRNVTLWSAPQEHVRDFFVKPTLDAKYVDGRVVIEAKVRNYGEGAVAPAKLVARLYGSDRKEMAGVGGEVEVPGLAAGEERMVRVEFPVSAPAKWTAETPNLYTLVLDLNGELLSQRVGFRTVEIRDRVFMVNGVAVKLKGVNRHENLPETGHAITEASMIRDLELIKQGNCNHIRTCHYSDDPRWYELCDEYGIYLVAEANIENHGLMGILDREPTLTKMYVERNVANVETFKNHPSVIIWSMGNECGDGSNLRACVAAVKALDPSRPTHYEGFGIGERNPADIDSQMYTHPDALVREAEDSRLKKPLYLCEYAHAMFNSMGSMGDYNDIFDKYPSLMGGAIWEWEDQGIWNRRDPKREFIAYGGGFGEFPNDHYFIHKGVVFSDRTPKPHYPEMKRVYQWVKVEAVDLAAGGSGGAGTIRVKNNYAFKNLGGLVGKWAVSADGKEVAAGGLEKLDLAPGAEAVVTVPGLADVKVAAGAVAFLRVSFELAKEEKWAPAGFEMAAAQFRLPVAAVAAGARNDPAVSYSDDGNVIRVKGKSFELVFDKKEATFTSMVSEGQELLIPGGGPELHLWRAPHRTDDQWASVSWIRNGLDHLRRQAQPTKVTQVDASTVRIESVVDLEGKERFVATHAANYTIRGDGVIAVDNAVICQGRRTPLARMGVRMQLNTKLDQFAYLGRGPMENYSDRKRGSDVGLYRSSVAGAMTAYAKPMESGNHEDVEWAAVGGAGVSSLMVMADKEPLQVSATPYTDEVMSPVEYRVDLPASQGTVLTVAARTMGVGSAGCGPRPLPQYLVWSTDPANFTYCLKLVPGAVTDLAEASRDRFTLAGGRPKLMPKPGIVPVAVPHGQVIEADSFEPREGELAYATDGDVNTYWHSRWSKDEAPMPHHLVLDYGRTLNVAGVTYVARVDGREGHVKDYEIYLSDAPDKWGKPVAKGTFPRDQGEVKVTFPATKGRYLKFVILSEQENRRVGSVAELEVIEAK